MLKHLLDELDVDCPCFTKKLGCGGPNDITACHGVGGCDMLPDMPDYQLTFNKVEGDLAVVRPWIQALNDSALVHEKAGFLFKVSLCDQRLLLAVEPCLIQGERRYHFNMHLAHEDAYTLVGAINAMGEFSILFKPENYDLSSGQCARYRQVISVFAGLLLDGGYAGDGRLDEVTQSLLSAVGYDPTPDRLSGLCQACL